MKLSKNRLYIEAYVKCPNCGILIFEGSGQPVTARAKLYCSSWCVEWEAEREARRQAEAAAP